MDLLQRFSRYVKEQNLFHPKEKLLLAISGGVDSVVLCELCKQAEFDFTIAHCNFQLRGEESERDEKFVRELGKKYGAAVEIKKFETEKYAAETGKGIQEAARDLRYDWFKELIAGKAAREMENEPDLKFSVASCILTAHHADDNIETVLMNFCRGTGLHGLEGIPMRQGSICRPLLSFWKNELIEFAKEHKLEYVEDSSNQSSKYTRNLFRNQVIPLISEAYPQLKANLLNNIDRVKESNKLYSVLLDGLKRKLLKPRNEEIHIPVRQLMSFDNRALIYEIIKDFGFTEKQVEEVVKLAGSESGKFIQSPDSTNRIIKFRYWFIVSPMQSSSPETIIIEEGITELNLPEFKIAIEKLPYSPAFRIPSSAQVACLDAKEISFPLILRRWRPSDYFYPLGMRKKKKLGRFFIDQHLSKTDREKIWVVEMDKKIIWITGLRIDDRFKITDKTKTVLKFSLETG